MTALLHAEITRNVIKVFKQVHVELGIGFLESVYSAAMTIALRDSGFIVEREVPVIVVFRGHPVGTYRIDLLVEKQVCVELKVCRAIIPSHEAQLLNYLRASRIEVALLLNFGIRPELRRFILTNDHKLLRAAWAPSGTPH